MKKRRSNNEVQAKSQTLSQAHKDRNDTATATGKTLWSTREYTTDPNLEFDKETELERSRNR